MADFKIIDKEIEGVISHYVTGVVYSPLAIDTDWETMTKADISKMAHDFIAAGNQDKIDTQHNQQESGAVVVESFIARKEDADDYPEGSWVITVRMPEGELWNAVKSGDINGFSVQALVDKVPKKVLVEVAKIASGVTEFSTEDGIDKHSHDYYIEFDDDGRVTFGVTDSSLEHKHEIVTTVSTEKEKEHSHRFFVE